MDDVSRLRDALAPVERAARSLPWARQRPWRTATHVRFDADLPTIDLHDLGSRAAEQAVDLAVAAGPDLATGAVCFVVGRGRHSIGQPVLPGVVGARLRHAAAANGWTVSQPRAGRFTLVLDPARAPASATGELGCGFRLWLLFVAAAALLAAANSCGLGP